MRAIKNQNKWRRNHAVIAVLLLSACTPRILSQPFISNQNQSRLPIAFISDGTNVFAQTYNSETGKISSIPGVFSNPGVELYGLTVHPSGKYIYFLNSLQHSVNVFSVDSSTGSLLPVSSPGSQGFQSLAFAVDPSGKWAYLCGTPGFLIYQFAIDQASGALTPLAVPSIDAGGFGACPINPYGFGMAFDSDSRWLYSLNGGNSNISQFSIDGSGQLAKLAPSTVSTGTEPVSLSVDFSNRWLYVQTLFPAQTFQYSISSADGTLSSTSSVSLGASGSTFYPLLIDPTNQWMYSGGVEFQINSFTGNLTSSGMTPPLVTGFSPSGAWAYGADKQYGFNSTNGQFSQIGSFSNYNQIVYILPGGKWAYSTGNFVINQYNYDDITGKITPKWLPNLTMPISNIKMSPNNQWAYLINSTGATIQQYSFDLNTGKLDAELSSVATGTNPLTLLFHPTQPWAYVLNINDNTISRFGVNQQTGELTAIDLTSLPAGNTLGNLDGMPPGAVIDPSGKWLYISSYSQNSISQFAIDSETGSLLPLATPTQTTGTGPTGMAIDSSGQWGYVISYTADSISQYSIDSGTGQLSPLATPSVTLPSGGLVIIADHTGKYIYASDYTGAIYQYSISPSTGELSLTSTAAATNIPSFLMIDPTNQWIYMGAQGGILQYAIDSLTGQLTPLSSNTCYLPTYGASLTLSTP